ncbi:MAG: FAD-dependent oxidoreductase [Bacilli bacterium]|nr:FAD-dependent oxidoreductase [Bacilli bacterium]
MYDCIIVGCGPSGMTAALYLLRAGKTVLLLEKDSIGGQIAKSPRLENYPTVKSISGSDWSDQLFDQVTELGAEFELEDVTEITKDVDVFRVKTNFNLYDAKSVIIAAGCTHRHLGLPREEELTGRGISYCAVCDGSFYKDQDVLLIGDANTALQYAISLSDICRSVFIATLFDKFFADEILVERMKKIPNIQFRHNLSAQEYIGEKELEAVRFEDTKTGEEVTIPAKGCFIAVGQEPHNEPFKNLVELDEKGFIVVDANMMTATKGLYAVGDCRQKVMRQVVTAISDGAIAAIHAANNMAR